MQYDEFPAMSTTLLVAAEGPSESLRQGFELVRRYVAEAEQRFSRFRDSSELSQLNRAAGQWFDASPELFGLVQEARTWHTLTSGLFDPSLLNALKQVGYDRSFAELGEVSEQAALAEAGWIRPPFAETQVDPEGNRILLPEGVQLDLGGVAKGWIAERAAEILGRHADACAVSAGGDMALRGLPAGQSAWPVSLEDPRDPSRVAAVLNVKPGSLATSSVTKRRWVQGEAPRHHILDPRRGLPADSQWLSVTVWAESATGAEAFAKALLIAGPEEVSALSGGLEELQFIAIRRDGTLWALPQSEEILRVAA